MDKKLTLNELQAALRQLKAKKSSGPDAITNEILTHLGNKATCKLMEIFNHSWATGTLPQTWREATMIPIPKKGKYLKQAVSYRLSHFDSHNILSNYQHGFRNPFASETGPLWNKRHTV